MVEHNSAVMRVSVVGLGKLGACMAAAIADAGHEVFGYDLHAEPVAALQRGAPPVQETGLAELIARNRDRLHATNDLEAAILASEITFVVVPTPSEPSGAFSLEHAEQAFRAIGHALRRVDRYHLVVLTSTVLPGSTRFRLIPQLEQAASRRCGPELGVCYSPEFIALGSVIEDFLNPDFTLIGEHDELAGSVLERAYRAILKRGVPCRRMSIENAELTKIAINTFVTTKITFANMLADLCERIPGGDIDVVSDALGLDRRIGRRYLTGAVSYGGPCFPRDNLALSYFARTVGTSAALAETTHAMNAQFVERLIERLQSYVDDGATIGVLGLAYKPNTHVIDESFGVALIERLQRLGARVISYDPLVGGGGNGGPVVLGNAATVDEVVNAADVVVIAQPDPVYLAARQSLVDRDKPLVLFDCWRLFADLSQHPGIQYVAVGRSINDAASVAGLGEIRLPHVG